MFGAIKYGFIVVFEGEDVGGGGEDGFLFGEEEFEAKGRGGEDGDEEVGEVQQVFGYLVVGVEGEEAKGGRGEWVRDGGLLWIWGSEGVEGLLHGGKLRERIGFGIVYWIKFRKEKEKL